MNTRALKKILYSELGHYLSPEHRDSAIARILEALEREDYYSLLTDKEIIRRCSSDIPLIKDCIVQSQGHPSYGVSSAGYDMRLGRRFLKPGGVSMVLRPGDPDFSWELETVEGDEYILGPGEVVLAESVEYFNIHPDLMAITLGKSTYARMGLLVNATPAEPGWKGKLTLELVNLNKHHSIALQIGKGIAQMLFFRIKTPARTYDLRSGKYQHQTGVTPPR